MSDDISKATLPEALETKCILPKGEYKFYYQYLLYPILERLYTQRFDSYISKVHIQIDLIQDITPIQIQIHVSFYCYWADGN